MGQTIAYVSDPESFSNFYEKHLKQSGINAVNIRDAGSASRLLRNKKVDLILMNLALLPASPGTEIPDGPETRELREAVQSNEPWRIGLYTIREIRREGSANRDTQIIVADIYEPSKDKFFPDAEQQVLNAGANKYSDDVRPLNLAELAYNHLKKPA